MLCLWPHAMYCFHVDLVSVGSAKGDEGLEVRLVWGFHAGYVCGSTATTGLRQSCIAVCGIGHTTCAVHHTPLTVQCTTHAPPQPNIHEHVNFNTGVYFIKVSWGAKLGLQPKALVACSGVITAHAHAFLAYPLVRVHTRVTAGTHAMSCRRMPCQVHRCHSLHGVLLQSSEAGKRFMATWAALRNKVAAHLNDQVRQCRSG
jgi:hypothetical protein